MQEINIECVTSERRGLEPINPASAVDVLTDSFGHDIEFRYNPNTRNVVARMDSFNRASLYQIAVALEQDCVAWYDDDTGRGDLIGPRAEDWGEFDRTFFERFDSIDK